MKSERSARRAYATIIEFIGFCEVFAVGNKDAYAIHDVVFIILGSALLLCYRCICKPCI